MAFSWFPKKPPIVVSGNDWMFKQWFQDVYRFMKGEGTPAISQTVDLNLSENFFYPVDATAGNVIVTLPLAATYANKKYMIKKTDAGVNTVTLTASAGDAIEGSATVILTSQYDWVEVYSDGINTWWKISVRTGGASSGVSLKTQVFTASGTFTWPTNSDGSTVEVVTVTLQGPGGGGGRGSNGSALARAGAGSGELLYKVPYYRAGVTTTTVTLNAAGVGATAAGNNGTNGGTAVFGTLIAAGGLGNATGTGGAGGGPGGGAGGTSAAPGNVGSRPAALDIAERQGSGGGGSGNAVNQNGGAGGPCQQNAGGVGGTGDAAGAGGGGGAASFWGAGCKGGNSPGVAGTAPGATDYGVGGGGGGGNTGGNQGNGSNGGPGLCIVEFVTF